MMIQNVLCTILLLLVTSCHWAGGGQWQLNQFTLQFEHLLLTAHQSNFFDPQYASGEEINRPPRATIKLLHLRSFAGLKIIEACLLYQVPLPHEKIEGVLKVVDGSCEIFAPPLDSGLRLNSVSNFRMQLMGGPKGHERYSQLRLHFTYLGREQELLFPLWNINRPDSPGIFRSSVQTAHGSPLIALGTGPNKFASSISVESPLLGTKEASYLNHDYLKCREVNEQCQTIKDQCHLCRYGHFPVASNQRLCPGNWERFCGPNRCGERGQMACLRGQYRGKEKALDANSMGICPAPLLGYFDDEGILVCL